MKAKITKQNKPKAKKAKAKKQTYPGPAHLMPGCGSDGLDSWLKPFHANWED
jgi:hypothetical protein